MSEKQTIFLSAVSGQFEACRKALRSDLAAKGAVVVVQEDFTQHGGTLLEKLEQYIASCDYVIALVGTAYGWQPEPVAIPKDAPDRSYSQWEYYFALGERLDGTKAPPKPIYVYFAAPDYLQQHQVEQSDTHAQQQQRFIEVIETVGADRSTFHSLNELRALVLRDLPISSQSKGLKRNLPDDLKGLGAMLNWLRREQNRKILSWLGGGVVVIVGGLWTAFLYFDNPSEPHSKPQPSITTGNIHSGGDTVVGSGSIDKRTFNYSGITDIELAKQLGVAESAVKNFLQLLEQKQVPIEDWDNALRQVAKRYKSLLKQAALLESDDPQVRLLQEQAKQAIDATEFVKAEALLQQAVELDNTAAEKFKANYIQRKRSAAVSQGLKAESAYTRFALSQAIEFYKLAIELAKQGEDYTKVAQFQSSLGMVYSDNAQYDQAIASNESALTHYLALEGEESIEVAALWNNLGAAWKSKGQYDKAIRYYEQALASDLKSLGPEHPSTVIDWNNLGLAWKSKGQYDKAIEYYEKALASDLKSLGPGHPTVATLWNNLGMAWYSKGQYDKAIEYYEKALASDLKSLGPGHPSVAIDWSNLGLAWDSKGQYDKAIEYYEKALASGLRSLGPGHPTVATLWNNLGAAWDSKGQTDKAIEYYEQALASDLKSLGPEHPSVAIDWNNLGGAWKSKGQYDKAIEYYEKALAGDLKSLGPEHPSVATFWNNLGLAWYSKGQYDKAIGYYEKALKVKIKLLGENHPSTILTIDNLEKAKQALADTVE